MLNMYDWIMRLDSPSDKSKVIKLTQLHRTTGWTIVLTWYHTHRVFLITVNSLTRNELCWMAKNHNNSLMSCVMIRNVCLHFLIRIIWTKPLTQKLFKRPYKCLCYGYPFFPTFTAQISIFEQIWLFKVYSTQRARQYELWPDNVG